MAHHADAEIAECVRCPMMRRRYLAGIFVKVLFRGHPEKCRIAERVRRSVLPGATRQISCLTME